ncbi:hypothetical protein RUM43_013361 [Polyplax serrata]|uniref:Supervillin n=1 Tax=Polyplax serrata TaxID=468196 RepID=A0AAN8S9M4_POLSC
MLPAKIEKHGINSLGKEQRIRHSNLGESKKKKKAEDKRQNPGIQAGESREAVAAKSPRNNSDSPPRVHKVPLSSDARHSSFRRDENKTDKRYGNSLDAQETEVTSLSAPRDQVLVRETKTSRLRAAGRNYDGGTPPSKLPSSDKKVKVSSDSSTQILLHKIVDKSHTRKSNVNRSNICADATTTSSLPGISELRRSHTKNISNICSKSQIVKSKEENSSLDFSLASSNLSKPAALITNCRNQKCLTDRDISKSAKCVETRKSQHCRKPTSDISDSPTSKDEGDRPSTSKSNSGKSCDATASPTTMDTSTSKLITHLDNTKTRKNNSQKNPRRNVQENIKKLLPLNPVIHSLSRSGDVKKQNIKVGTKKVEQSLFENYGNASRTQKSSMLINSQQPSVSVAPQQSSSSDGTNAGKTSILKSKRISSSGTPLREVQKSKPISILKRKSATHEETLADSPPVTFSSLTLEKENDPKKQGILKKRRSLDENYVLKRHSSPDAILTDFKSILKRSSMEDLTLRSCSPDSYVLQGILKRKYSKEEEPEVGHASGNLVEPHSILKRKWPSSNAQQHLLPDVGDYQSCENVRPILKKKSSEEQNTSDPLLPEVPRSILKKKSGLENEEIDEKPKRPILKSCRLPSAEDSEIEPPLDMEPVKPILKMDISCHRHTEEFEISGCQVNPERSHSSGQMKVLVELQRKSSSSECNLHSLSIQKFRMEDRGHTADPGGCEEKRQTKAKSLTYPKVETKPLDAIISDNTSQESIQKDTIVSVICAPENTSDETEASRSVENQMISLGCFNMEEEREITKKTGSGSAIEEESNMSAEEEKERKLTGGSRAYIRRRNEKRISNTKKQRFHTQPISSEDIKLSLSGNRVQKEQKAEDEKYEDELSCLSYAERLRLFESTVTAPTLPRMSKSDGKPRGLRFRTQPVTTIEVEKAKSQRTTCLAECLDSKKEPTATDPKELERSKVETDASSYLNLKFKENLGAILKSTRDNSETGRSERNKSSVSNEEEGKLESWRTTTTGKKPGSQFLNEMNNILKPLPALQKSRSKGGYSSEVPETRSVSSIIRRAQQVAACLEKKKTNERQGTSEVLEKDNVSFDRSTKSSLLVGVSILQERESLFNLPSEAAFQAFQI